MHLGPYPMERVARVKLPTTGIDPDLVPRVPHRANFFSRAVHGDLGPRMRENVQRFLIKTPLSRSLRDFAATHVAHQTGETSAAIVPETNDPRDNARHIKSLLYFLGADIVGICEIPDYAWYSHDAGGQPIETRHRYAIVMAIDQGFDTMDASSGNDWISSSQSQRAYLMGSTYAITAANYIRELGYPAEAHTNARSDLLQLPLALLAGIGELSRIGEVLINPFLGPRFKTAVISTDLPLTADDPIDFGLQDFCGQCRKCARECPCGAIPFGDKVMFNGYEMWKPDVENCTKYRISNPGGASCGRCMKVCPFNKEGLVHHRLAMWLAIRWPSTRKALIWLDDFLGYGERNQSKKWWLDLELKSGQFGFAQKTNKNDLNPRKPPPSNHRVAIYAADVMPPADADDARPIDRAAALKAGRGSDEPG